MAATKIPKGIELITQFVRGQFAKRSAKKTGIASLKKASDSIVQSNVRNIEIILKDMGVDINKLKSTDDILKHMNIHKAMTNQYIKKQFGSLDLDKGIKSLEKKKVDLSKYTDKDLNALVAEDKRILAEANKLSEAGTNYGRVSEIEARRKEIREILKAAQAVPESGYGNIKADLALQKQDAFKGFNPRVQQDVDSIIKDLKNMEPVAAMKEANSIIGRKGKYKNLSGDEAQRILKETDDHIFQRDIQYDEFGDPIKPDPEDMASGGRTGYAVGQLVKGGKWFLKSLYDTKKQLMQLDIPLSQKKELMKQADDAIKYIEGGGAIPEQIIQHIRKDPKFRSVTQTRSADPDLAEMEEVILEYGKKHADGGRIGMMYGGDPGFAFEYGGSWADWHDQHRDQMPVEQYIKTKLPKHRLPFREMQSGGLAYMLGEPTYMKYGAGGSVGHAPWLKPTGQQAPQGQTETPTPNVASRPDPMKAPRGLPSLAPKNMDPAYMQQQMMQKAMMGQGPRTTAAEGGIMRMGFKKGGDMSRRGFLKLIAGLAALPVVGKFFKLAKPAAKVAETFTHVPIKDIPGMPVWFKPLVARVIKEGTDVTEQFAVKDLEVVHRTKLPTSGTDVMVTQQLDTGDVLVDIGMGKHGWSAGRYGQPARLEYKAAEDIMTGPSDEPFKMGERDPLLRIKTEVHEDLVGTGLKGDPKNLHLKPGKTKEEFFVDEAEFTGGHPENVKFEETVGFKYGDHGSDFSEVERYAIGKNKDKKIIGKQADKDAWAEGRAESQADEYDKMRDEGYFDEAEKDFYEGKASGGLAGLLGE